MDAALSGRRTQDPGRRVISDGGLLVGWRLADRMVA